jgi:uncharacterized protein with HEPN domain
LLRPRDWRLRVEDILDAADRIDQYVEGLDGVRFQADRKTVDAVVRNREIIGEAATHLARVQDELPPDIPWADVSGIRNVLIHEYFGDLANLAVAALVFGQALGEDRFSLVLGAGREPMTTALFTLGGIAVIAFSIALMDWLARRKDSRSKHRGTAV